MLVLRQKAGQPKRREANQKQHELNAHAYTYASVRMNECTTRDYSYIVFLYAFVHANVLFGNAYSPKSNSEIVHIRGNSGERGVGEVVFLGFGVS